MRCKSIPSLESVFNYITNEIWCVIMSRHTLPLNVNKLILRRIETIPMSFWYSHIFIMIVSNSNSSFEPLAKNLPLCVTWHNIQNMTFVKQTRMNTNTSHMNCVELVRLSFQGYRIHMHSKDVDGLLIYFHIWGCLIPSTPRIKMAKTNDFYCDNKMLPSFRLKTTNIVLRVLICVVIIKSFQFVYYMVVMRKRRQG